MAQFILVHDSQSLGAELLINTNAIKMICKMVGTGTAMIRISEDPRMPIIACSESYSEVIKMVNYVKANTE